MCVRFARPYAICTGRKHSATILRTGSATLPDGRVVDTIVVRDFNPLDGSRGTKVYGQGVGLIEDGPLRLLRVNGV